MTCDGTRTTTASISTPKGAARPGIRQAGPRNTTQESSKFFIYKNLLDSCLRILRCLQFESATLRGPLVSDASQLLPLIWHYAYRPKPNRFWQLLLVYRHIHHRTRRPRVHPYIAKKDSAHRCRVGKASPSPVRIWALTRVKLTPQKP